ncbi:MAG: hypothetical protein H8D56_19230 [Planctomycetes bacterium]|nr:hypothetical protein [Planctomycetota bacterium]
MKPYVLIFLLAFIFWGLALSENAFANDQASQEDHDPSSFSLLFMVKPLGIATLCLVFTTFLTGLFRRKLRLKFLKIHLPLAIISVFLGLTHGVLVLILYG